jgi:HSP20 family molecular chaperone IbpA
MAQNMVAQKEEAKTDVTTREPTRGGICYTPRVDIVETEDELVVYADMPGCRPEDVDIRYENGELEIHGKCPTRQENVDYLVNEFGVGDYYRSFTINEAIDATKITATFKQGVLTVHLPKSEAAKPRRIAVKPE